MAATPEEEEGNLDNRECLRNMECCCREEAMDEANRRNQHRSDRVRAQYQSQMGGIMTFLSLRKMEPQKNRMKKKASTAGFEPAQAKPNRFRVCLLNHSDISTDSCTLGKHHYIYYQISSTLFPASSVCNKSYKMEITVVPLYVRNIGQKGSL